MRFGPEPVRQVVRLRRGFGEITPAGRGVGMPPTGGTTGPRNGVMDLHTVEAVGIGRLRKDLSDIIRCVEGGTHYLLLRRDRPVAALISHADYLALSELARKDALARALLQGKGYDPGNLSVQEFLDLLAVHVKGGGDAGD